MTSSPADDPRVARIVAGVLAACDPREATRRALERRRLRGPISILAFGKCAVPMMLGALDVVAPVEALVVTVPSPGPGARENARLGERRAGGNGGELPTPPARAEGASELRARGVVVRTGAHPDPSEDAPTHATEALAIAARAEGMLLTLVSGGGSALLELPAPGVTIATISDVARMLMRRGAPIEDLNVVRAALSAVKGGRLAAATRARVLTLVVEDVPGRPDLVASGPTAAPPAGSATEVLSRWGLDLDGAAREALARPPAPWHGGELEAIVTNEHARAGALRAVRAMGFAAVDGGPTLRGEARDAGAALARRVSLMRVGCILGGETTVAVRGNGHGGRNQELVLAAYLERAEGLVVSFGTDGIDGASTHAGAYLTPERWQRAAALGLDAQSALAENDSASFFAQLGSAIVTGPTGVNVADLVCALPDLGG